LIHAGQAAGTKRERIECGERKARRVFPRIYSECSLVVDEEFVKKRRGMLHKTRKPCSNPFCCGNPRRIRGQSNPALQEKKYAGDLVMEQEKAPA